MVFICTQNLRRMELSMSIWCRISIGKKGVGRAFCVEKWSVFTHQLSTTPVFSLVHCLIAAFMVLFPLLLQAVSSESRTHFH